jgi:secondary thiamine-phosphate synthase enzyme
MSNFKVSNAKLNFTTAGELEFVDLTDKVTEFVSESGIRNGIVHAFAPHATGVLILTENDPDLIEDIRKFIENLVPTHGGYKHPSNAHSHLRSMLLPPDKTMPIIDGHVQFGTWQSLLFLETDVYPRNRTIILQALGEK